MKMAERSRRMRGTFHRNFSIMGVNTRLSGINLTAPENFRGKLLLLIGQ
jgi:hypothetical protein